MRLASLVLAVPALAIPLAGCFIDETHSQPACAADTSYQIDTGATVTYAPGVDAGYYLAYAAGGHWHFEWTCDTKLSAAGCNFTGTIVVDTPAGGTGATCFQCEPGQDSLAIANEGTQTELSFDTVTTTGIDGVDFYGVPGHPVQVDLMVDGLYQNDLVFIPSRGNAASPVCMPTSLVPSAP